MELFLWLKWMIFLYNKGQSPHFLYFYDKKNVLSVFQRRPKKMEKGMEDRVIVVKSVVIFFKIGAGRSNRKAFGTSILVKNRHTLKSLEGRKEASNGFRKHWTPAIFHFRSFLLEIRFWWSIQPILAEALGLWYFDALCGRKIFFGNLLIMKQPMNTFLGSSIFVFRDGTSLQSFLMAGKEFSMLSQVFHFKCANFIRFKLWSDILRVVQSFWLEKH